MTVRLNVLSGGSVHRFRLAVPTLPAGLPGELRGAMAGGHEVVTVPIIEDGHQVQLFLHPAQLAAFWFSDDAA